MEPTDLLSVLVTKYDAVTIAAFLFGGMAVIAGLVATTSPARRRAGYGILVGVAVSIPILYFWMRAQQAEMDLACDAVLKQVTQGDVESVEIGLTRQIYRICGEANFRAAAAAPESRLELSAPHPPEE